MRNLSGKTNYVKIIENTSQITNNSSVIYIAPEVPSWIKTSLTGKFLFDTMQENVYTINEIIKITAEYYKISEETISKSVQNFIQDLVENKMAILVDDKGESFCKDLKTSTDFNQLNSLLITINSDCNLSCSFCYLPKKQNTIRMLSIDNIKKIISDARLLEIKQLVITGGEPFLHPDLIEIVKICRTLEDVNILLITNGKIIAEDNLAEICKLVDVVQISVDGITEKTHDSLRGKGAFIEAMQTINKIIEHNNCKCAINFTPFPENINDIPSLADFAISKNIHYLKIGTPKIPGSSTGRSRFKKDKIITSCFYQKVLDQIIALSKKILEIVMHCKEYDIPLKLAIDTTFEYYHKI